MITKISRRGFLASAGLITGTALLSACSTPPGATSDSRYRQSVWTSYPVGSASYNDLAAVANAITGSTGIQVRLMTADSGVGRLAPLVNGTAHYSRVTDEYYYAFEGNEEFAAAEWGPRPLRAVWTPPTSLGMYVRRDSGIKTVEDLKGRKVPKITASTSNNRKIQAILSYGGLTMQDVEPVKMSYSEQYEAMKTGQIDTAYASVAASALQELVSQHPIQWLDLGSTDESRFSEWEDLVPMAKVAPLTSGPGVEAGEKPTVMQYTLPIVTTADRPIDEVRLMTQEFDELYDQYKSVTTDTPQFALDKLMITPMVIPFHEGVIELFKSAGRWTPDAQARQDALLEREQSMAAAWPKFWDSNKHHADVAKRWFDYKKDKLPALPEITDMS